MDVDGVSAEPPVFVEVFAHQGPLKGGQRHKIAGDVLKLSVSKQQRIATRLQPYGA